MRLQPDSNQPSGRFKYHSAKFCNFTVNIVSDNEWASWAIIRNDGVRFGRDDKPLKNETEAYIAALEFVADGGLT